MAIEVTDHNNYAKVRIYSMIRGSIFDFRSDIMGFVSLFGDFRDSRFDFRYSRSVYEFHFS